MLYTKLYVLHKGEFPISMPHSARNVQKYTGLNSLKFSENTEIFKRYFKLFCYGDVCGFCHQTFPRSVVIIYSEMAPALTDDVVSFSSFLTPSYSPHYPTMFSVAPNSPADRVIPVMLC